MGSRYKYNSLTALAFSADSTALAVATADRIQLWRVADLKLLYSLNDAYNCSAQELDFTSAGKLFFRDHIVRGWHTNGGTAVPGLQSQVELNYFKSVVGDDEMSLGADVHDNSVRLWRLSDWALLRTLTIPKSGWQILQALTTSKDQQNGTLQEVAFAPDGSLVAACSSSNKGGRVFLWRVADGSYLRTLETPSMPDHRMRFSPDGSILATSSKDMDSIHLWRVSDGVLLCTLKGEWRRIKAEAFSNDNKLLAVSSYDNDILVWRVADGVLLMNWRNFEDVNCLAFSPDRTLLVSGTLGGVHLWRLDNATLLRRIAGHITQVNSIAFSPDGRTIASACCGGVVRLWQAYYKASSKESS